MSFHTATQVGVDLIAPAVTIFTIWYAFRPWYASHIGRAIMAHSVGSMVLFDLAAFSPVLPERYPGQAAVTLFIVALWIFGWWYMVFALWLTRNKHGGVSE